MAISRCYKLLQMVWSNALFLKFLFHFSPHLLLSPSHSWSCLIENEVFESCRSSQLTKRQTIKMIFEQQNETKRLFNCLYLIYILKIRHSSFFQLLFQCVQRIWLFINLERYENRQFSDQQFHGSPWFTTQYFNLTTRSTLLVMDSFSCCASNKCWGSSSSLLS
jgi:hypothetical protein